MLRHAIYSRRPKHFHTDTACVLQNKTMRQGNEGVPMVVMVVGTVVGMATTPMMKMG